MILPSCVKVLLNAILAPILSMWALKQFNLFEFISLIPVDRQFDFGLTAYLALSEALLVYLETFAEKHTAQISCIFYSEKSFKDENNTPKIVCGQTSSHVAKIYCEIHISGNTALLRKAKLTLTIPSWVTSQISANETVLSYSENTLCWSFANLIANSNEKESQAEHTILIPFIDEEEVSSSSSIVLRPELQGWLSKLRVSFKSNKFQLANKE